MKSIDIVPFKEVFKRIDAYLLTVLAFALAAGLFLVTHDKVTEQLLIDETHSPLQDKIFKIATLLGDGLFVSLAVLSISLWHFKAPKKRLATLLLSTGTLLIAGGSVQFLKRVVFPHAYRPAKRIGLQLLHPIPGVTRQYSHSFPSGHAAMSFALFTLLAFLCAKRKYQQVLLALCAASVAYSRVYLSQHFMEDILAGSLLGAASLPIAYALLNRAFGLSKRFS